MDEFGSQISAKIQVPTQVNIPAESEVQVHQSHLEYHWVEETLLRDVRQTWIKILEDNTTTFSQQIKVKRPLAQKILEFQQLNNGDTQNLYLSIK